MIDGDRDGGDNSPRLSLIERAARSSSGNVPVIMVGALMTGAVSGSAADMFVTASAGLSTDLIAHVIRERKVLTRQQRSQDTMRHAADKADLTPLEVVQRFDAHEGLPDLAEAVLSSAEEHADETHRRMLAQCLANGLDDATRIEAEALIARVMRDLTPPHVTLLVRLSLPIPTSTAVFSRYPVWDLETIEDAMPGMVGLLDPLMALLEQHGLVFQKSANHSRARNWVITDFGRTVVERLEDEGLNTRRPSSEPRFPEWVDVMFAGPAHLAGDLAELLSDRGVEVDQDSRLVIEDPSTERVSGYIKCLGYTRSIDKAIAYFTGTYEALTSRDANVPPLKVSRVQSSAEDTCNS